MPNKPTILDRWEITAEELTEIVDANPSMRGLMLGYVAEFVLRRQFFEDPRIAALTKDDDHARKQKGDLRFVYGGYEFRLECKSLQSNSVRRADDGAMTARFQCDASDRRTVTLPNGSKLETTCLLAGEFDLLAVNLFAFAERWQFAFALNRDLPRSAFAKYTKYQRRHLLASLMPVTWPLAPPYADSPFPLLDRLVAERAGRRT